MARPSAGSRLRWSALPWLLRRAHPRVVLLVGFLMTCVGLLIVARPLTSLYLLALYIGVSAVVSGVFEFAVAHSGTWWGRAMGLGWIALGLAILFGLGRSLDLMPGAIAILLMLGGLASFGDAVRSARVTERVLAASWGAAQIVFGYVAFAWPDATVLVAAVVFGIRTLVLGVSFTVRGARGVATGAPTAFPPPDEGEAPSRTARAWADAGRIALAIVVATAAGGAWWINDWLADGAPVIDAFYDPPDDVPAAHGELIRSDDYIGRMPEGATVRRILYTTQDAHGAPAVGSGLVISPAAVTWTPRPVVLWNHGTTGVAQGCAPSMRDDAATKWAIPALDDALERGWVVVAPDYTGQGAPGVYPYLIGLGEARSALDAVLAADQVQGVWLRDEVVVWGHSQGGHAALWSSQIAAEYAPQLDVVGTAALAPAADPHRLASELTVGDSEPTLAILISWVLGPYSQTYADVDLDDYVVPGARTIVDEMTRRCPSEPGAVVSLLAALGVSEETSLYVGDLTTGPLGRRLAENAATGPWEEPLLVAWGTEDEVIPTSIQRTFVEDACADGSRVRWVVERGSDHRGVMMPGSRVLPVLVDFSADLLAGGPAPADGCAFFASSP